MIRTVLALAASIAALLAVDAAHAQTAPDYTGDLNAMPGASRPAQTPPAAQPQPQPQTQPAAVPPSRVQTPAPTPAPAPAPQAPARVVPPTAQPPAAQPPVAQAPTAQPPAAPRVLTRAEIEALPFSISLPTGYVLTAGRAAPDSQVWTVRKGGLAQLMIYAGPLSQFPIHDGEMVDAGGRTTVVVIEDGRRRALEHLFRQSSAPNHIHVWIASVDGADRDQAEAIGHGVSPR